MAFQDIITIEKPQFYLDVAISSATKTSERMRSKKLTGDKLQIVKQVYLIKIDTIHSQIYKRFSQILKTFPQIDELAPYYQELVKISLPYVEVKQALGALNWANNKIKDLTKSSKAKIIQSTDPSKSLQLYKEYIGRISSVVKQMKDSLFILEGARKEFKAFPQIKTNVPTVAIVGFPNIGKTTLLYKLTGSKPEINEYAFTTKKLNIAYLRKDKTKIQFLDTPGTLNRFEKMNNIEKQASLALEHLTHHIIYVFDLTEPFPLKDQIALYEKIKELKLPTTLYLSKTDILKKEQIEEFSKKYTITTDIKELKSIILKKIKA
tara:strand:- start:1688 stop:2650 length:963 start_codon:yes stop_codon:yes gene_type:complete